MPDREDENQQAVRQVDKATKSGPANGEDLLNSEDLKQQLREAKQRSASSAPPSER